MEEKEKIFLITESLKEIQKICGEHKDCFTCPFYANNPSNCFFKDSFPFYWNIDSILLK